MRPFLVIIHGEWRHQTVLNIRAELGNRAIKSNEEGRERDEDGELNEAALRMPQLERKRERESERIEEDRRVYYHSMALRSKNVYKNIEFRN